MEQEGMPKNHALSDIEAKIQDVFEYHKPDEDGINAISRIREGAKMFARIILMHTPKSADQSAAIRKVREAMMTANAAVVLGGRNF